MCRISRRETEDKCPRLKKGMVIIMKKHFLKSTLLIAVTVSVLGLTSCKSVLQKLPFEIPFLSKFVEDDEPEDSIVLIKNNEAQFQIVHTSEAGTATINYSKKVVEQLRSLGVKINDPISDEDPSLVTDCELIIGTGVKNRGEEVCITAKDVGEKGFAAKVVGKRIVLAGGTSALTKTLYESFVRNEMKLTDSTTEMKSLYIRADYAVDKPTDYRIDKISIAGIDLKEFVLVYDIDALNADDKKTIENFREELYSISGYWLKVGEISKLDTYEHSFVIRINESTDSQGFNVHYDGKNFIAECAYANVFADGFSKFAKETFIDSPSNKISLPETYLYDKFNAVYEHKIKSVSARTEAPLEELLALVKAGRGTAYYGAPATAVLGMSSGDIKEEDLQKANAAIVECTNYIENSKNNGGDTQNGRGEVDFVSIRIVRLLYSDQSKIEAKTQSALNRFFLNDNFLSVIPSENHYLMSYASRYLAACHYEGEYFNQFGMTAEEIKKIDHDYLVEYMQYRGKQGWGEFNSIGYEVHNFNTLLALYECAPDADIRNLAEMLMETMLLTMIQNTTEGGIYGGAHGRAGDSVVSGLDKGIYWLDYLYFGHGDFEDTSDTIPTFSEPFILLSNWRPDISLYRVYAEKTYSFNTYERVQNFTPQEKHLDYGSISKYTYNTKYYSIGCINTQDQYIHQTWYEEHQQTNWSLVFANNPNASIIVHHPGNDNGSHNYWYGDQMCHCNHLFGNENVVMGVFYIPNKDDASLDYIHANIPKGQYDKVVEDKENNRLFIKCGDAYAALTFSAPYEWGGRDAESEIVIYDGDKTTDIRIAFACEAGDKEANASFEEFITSVKNKEFKFNRQDLSLKYGNMSYDVIVDGSDSTKIVSEIGYINGVKQPEHYEYTYNSPFMKSKWDSGIIEIYYDGKVRTLDFINITDTTK